MDIKLPTRSSIYNTLKSLIVHIVLLTSTSSFTNPLAIALI